MSTYMKLDCTVLIFCRHMKPYWTIWTVYRRWTGGVIMRNMNRMLTYYTEFCIIHCYVDIWNLMRIWTHMSIYETMWWRVKQYFTLSNFKPTCKTSRYTNLSRHSRCEVIFPPMGNICIMIYQQMKSNSLSRTYIMTIWNNNVQYDISTYETNLWSILRQVIHIS